MSATLRIHPSPSKLGVRQAKATNLTTCMAGGHDMDCLVCYSGGLGGSDHTGPVAVGLLVCAGVVGAVAVGFRMHSKRNVTADGESPPLRAAQTHEGTTREEFQVQYGRVTEDSDCESKMPKPPASFNNGDGQPSRQSQYM
eukprot:COSAG02_NODE_8181_length_2673_cov_1.366744_2_plen_141_part_00